MTQYTGILGLKTKHWLTGLLLTAVFTIIAQPAMANYQGPGLYRQALGSKVTLNHDIEISEGVRIHIQNGEVIPFGKVTQLEPYCYFYSTRGKDKLKDPFHVKQGQFIVNEVIRRREIVLSTPVQIASFGGSFFNNGGVQYTLATRFQINDALQPDLDSLICSVWADPRDRGFVTFNEIEETLGTIASMELVNQ